MNLPPLNECRLAVIGLGLMGASLAIDLRGHCREIVGVSRSPETLAYALEQGVVDQIVSFEQALECDLIILAAPVRTILRQLAQISRVSSPSTGTRKHASGFDPRSRLDQVRSGGGDGKSTAALRATRRPSDVRQGSCRHPQC